MARSLIERRLHDVTTRLTSLRHELAVLDEQLVVFNDAADEARLRALVSETPLADQEQREASRHADAMTRSRADLAAPLMAVRVVLAEDEAIIRLDLKETLEEEGYEVVGETGRGDEAVALVKEHSPDLAILDIKMPGLDGLAAAREIAGERRAAVLILTAFSQRDLVKQAT